MIRDENEKSLDGSPPPEGWPQDGVGNKDILTTINNISIIRKKTSYLPANRNLGYRARSLRRSGNLPEIVFWQQVHKGKFYNIDFDRQRVIGSYIVDFYIKGLGLIIEIDGASHNDKVQYDERRETYLRSLGLQIWKVSSTEVMMDIERVMENLKNYIIQNYS